MKGSIHSRGNTYFVKYDIPRGADGKRKQKQKDGFKTKREAREYLALVNYELVKNIYVEEKNLRTGDYLKKWLSEDVKPNVKETTYSGYETNIKKHIIPELGHIKLAELKPIHVHDLYNKKINEGLSPTTILYIHRNLYKALKQAVKLELIYRNVCESVDPPKKEKYEAKTYNENQVKTL